MINSRNVFFHLKSFTYFFLVAKSCMNRLCCYGLDLLVPLDPLDLWFHRQVPIDQRIQCHEPNNLHRYRSLYYRRRHLRLGHCNSNIDCYASSPFLMRKSHVCSLAGRNRIVLLHFSDGRRGKMCEI